MLEVTLIPHYMTPPETLRIATCLRTPIILPKEALYLLQSAAKYYEEDSFKTTTHNNDTMAEWLKLWHPRIDSRTLTTTQNQIIYTNSVYRI